MHDVQLKDEILKRVDELVRYTLSIDLKDKPAREEQLTSAITLVKEMGDLLMVVLEGREEHLQALLEQIVAQRIPDERVLQGFDSFSSDMHYIINEGTARYIDSLHTIEQEKNDPENHTTEAFVSNSHDKHADVEEVPDLVDVLEISPGVISEDEKTNLENNITDDFKTGAIETEGIADQEMPLETPTDIYQEINALPETAAPDAPYEIPCPDPSLGPADNLEALRLALLYAYQGEEIIENYLTSYGRIPFYLPRLQLGFEFATERYRRRYDFYCRREGLIIRFIEQEELKNPIFLARRLRKEVGLPCPGS